VPVVLKGVRASRVKEACVPVVLKGVRASLATWRCVIRSHTNHKMMIPCRCAPNSQDDDYQMIS
jgi:hypothetical protein